MIVSDLGTHWQLVRQPDHGVLCGAFARRWGNGDFRPAVAMESLATAAQRHDDGWSIWERVPDQDPESGRPLNFLDIGIPVHLAFWRATTAVVSSQDPYAGTLISLHGAGIYRQRYGMQPSLKLTFADEVRDQVDAFVREQERAWPGFVEQFGVNEQELWGNYRYLQVYDLLSLYFSGQSIPDGLQAGQPGVLAPVPVDYDDGVAEITVEPLGDGRYRLDPYPFDGRENDFTLVRRRLEKREWDSEEAFREALSAAPEETLAFRLVA